jgi:hypothetical protein
VIVNGNYNHLSLKDYAAQKEGTENRKYVDTSIDGIPALKVTGLEGLGAGYWNIYIVKGDVAYIITQNLMDENQFKQIFSTFKIINRVSSNEDWKNYFSIQYPSDLQIITGSESNLSSEEPKGTFLRIDFEKLPISKLIYL